ncbi:uncharacterized protein LOC113005987 [Solenopsis invicta]|uniref:uncharacterized protein LOC113005987 n=1 Tax=Solenopsis invicta TaxID=13686 RepID=UPI00193EA71A|nr:uncharacterized protein LOC113005987 [Solenopsis invicta]
MENQEAETVSKSFYSGWISRFGVPLRITTDQGRQLESQLFRQLNELTGSKHLRTTAYHPQANGLVERFHRQLKAAIKCHGNNKWTITLPTILLGIRSAWHEDLGATTAQLVYGETLRLPGQFINKLATATTNDTAQLVTKLRNQFNHLNQKKGQITITSDHSFSRRWQQQVTFSFATTVQNPFSNHLMMVHLKYSTERKKQSE